LSPELLTPSTSTKNGQDTARSSSSSKLPFREINFKNKLKAIKERLQKVIHTPPESWEYLTFFHRAKTFLTGLEN